MPDVRFGFFQKWSTESDARCGVKSGPIAPLDGMSASPPILSQNSQNAVRSISRKWANPAAIADRCRPQAITEVACEFIAEHVVPQVIIQSPRVRPGKFVLADAKRLLQQYPTNSRPQQGWKLGLRKRHCDHLSACLTATKTNSRVTANAPTHPPRVCPPLGARWASFGICEETIQVHTPMESLARRDAPLGLGRPMIVLPMALRSRTMMLYRFRLERRPMYGPYRTSCRHS
jgi:hypothetical protein